MPHAVPILATDWVTHNVRRFRLEKPTGFRFEPGQATDVAIDEEGWRERRRPFTFTSLNDWEQLEFTIKIYPERHAVTERLADLAPGARLLIDEPWGTISYAGPGTFIAGGAGITPFIAILRSLAAAGELEGNTLIFSNRSERDIILREEFEKMAGLERLWVLTDEPAAGLAFGRIDADFLRRRVTDPGGRFYVCGPDQMVGDIRAILEGMGARSDSVTFEA